MKDLSTRPRPEGACRDRRARRWGKTVGAVALIALAITMAELYRAGRPFGPLRKPAVYPWAALAALSGAAWASLRRGRWALPACFAAATFAVYLMNGRRLPSGDTKPATLIPYALVRNGTLALDGLVAEPLPAWVERRGSHVWSHYPVTAGIMALPVYLPAALGPGRAGALPEAEKVAAALLAAASVGFVLAIFLELAVPVRLALLGAATYGFASSIFSTAGQALWQHGPGALALSAGIWCSVRSRGDLRWATWAGLCAGVAVAARPTNVLAAGALVAWQLLRGRGPAARALVGAAVPLSLLALYNAVAFGAPWATGYGHLTVSFGSHLAEGLAGVLFSPTRGLITFVPWTPVALVGLLVGARRDSLYASALAAAGAILVVHALWNDWAGGWCFGPRLVSDATPLLALGLAPVLMEAHRRPLALASLLIGATLGAWLSWLAAFRPEASLARDVYLGSDVHAMEWWRYPPLRLARELLSRR
jgi:hypothetical protein